jgi:hypothetical protein
MESTHALPAKAVILAQLVIEVKRRGVVRKTSPKAASGKKDQKDGEYGLSY